MVKRKQGSSGERDFVFEDMGSAREANLDGRSEADVQVLEKHLQGEKKILEAQEQGKHWKS